MKRRWMILGLLLALAAIPAAGQEEIIGFLEPPVVPAATPSGDPPLHGIVRVFGWVVAESPVRRVTIQVNGVDVGEANYHQFRPLVEDMFPGFPDSSGAGFGYNLNATDFPNGVHRVTAKVLTTAGSQVILDGVDSGGLPFSPGEQEIFFTFNTNTLPPFGAIDRPQRNAELFGNCCRRTGFNTCCDLNEQGFCVEEEYDGLTAIPYSVVEGWALDLGVEIGDSGVGWVELLVDGVIIGNTRLTCDFDLATGGLTDCYGLPRLDIENRFPFAIDAPTSGFRFAMDVGALVRFGFNQGSHTLTIRAGDIGNLNANIHEIPVNFLCVNNLDNQQSFGRIESPRIGRAYADEMTFQGWALDLEGIDRIELFVDGLFIGQASFGVGSRPEVLSEFPGYPDSLAPVWRLTPFDTRDLSEGNHQVQAVAFDETGDATVLGEVTFFVNNEVD